MLLALGLTPAYPNRTVETDPVGEVTTITVQGTRGGRQTVATAVVVTQP